MLVFAFGSKYMVLRVCWQECKEEENWDASVTQSREDIINLHHLTWHHGPAIRARVRPEPAGLSIRLGG